MHVKRCEDCPFGIGKGVGSRGPLDAPVVFLGESPGFNEVRDGIPFIGSSGSVIDDTSPFSVDEVLVLNALKCSPTKKDASTMRAAVRACNPSLMEELQAYPRKVIFSMGGPALSALTGDFSIKITKERGKVFPSELASKGIVAAVHPAFLLRGGGSLRQFKGDIQRAYDLYKGNGIGDMTEPSPSSKLYLVSSLEDMVSVMSSLSESRFVVADIETTGLDPFVDDILCIGLYNGDYTYIVPDHLIYKYPIDVSSFLTRVDVKFVWHNGKFDVRFLRHEGLNGKVDDDTMLLSYCLDERRGSHDLETVAQDLLNIPDYKFMVQKYLKKKSDSYALIPRDVLYDYLGKDCTSTSGIYHRLRRKVSQDKALEKLYTKTLVPLSELITRIELRGFLVDQGRIEANGIDIQQEMYDAEAEFLKFADGPVNLNAPGQVAAVLYDRLKLYNKYHNRSTAKDVLDKLPKHPAITALKEHRRAAKLYNTYIKGLSKHIKSDGKVHPSILIHGTETGRLAMKAPPMQTIPRESRIRGMFRAPEGRCLLSKDFDQAELRVLAYESQDEYLLEVYYDGKRKLHHELSLKLYGEGYNKEQYMSAKAVNFGIAYGRESFSLAEEFNITTTEAQRMINTWFEQAPGAHKYLKKLKGCPKKNVSLITPFGRKKRPGLVTQETLKHLQNEYCNFPMQSIANDLTLHVSMRSDPELVAIDCYIIHLVHDNIITDCPQDKDIVEEADAIINKHAYEVPIEWLKTDLPFPMDTEITTHWGDTSTRVNL